jgi:hypothetical protein
MALTHPRACLDAHSAMFAEDTARRRLLFLRVLEADHLVAQDAGYGDAKVANREIRVWHGATENGP